MSDESNLSQQFTQDPSKYLSEPRRKDYYDHLYTEFVRLGINNIVDIGCASGDFLFLMPSHLNGLGIDVSNELIQIARETRIRPNLYYSQVDFYSQSFAENVRNLPIRFDSNDAITLLGTLSTLFDFREALTSCLSLSPKHIFINSWFNTHDVDVRCAYRRSDQPQSEFNYGFNIFSLATAKHHLDALGLKYNFAEYHMQTSLHKTDDELSSWHIFIGNDKFVTNGTGLILKGFNLHIICS